MPKSTSKARQSLSQNMLSTNRRILLFDLGLGGHHGAYIQHLIRYWSEQYLPGHVDIVVHPEFLQQHQDVAELVQTFVGVQVNFVPITEEEEAELGPWSTFVQSKRRSLREWSLLNRYANRLGATECLLMFFDTLQLSAVLRRQLPCPFSGIYFRARFHYGEFQHTLSWRDHIRHWLERLQIAEALRHPQLKTLFCLDEFAVKHLIKFHSNSRVVYLPDPVQLYPYSLSEVELLRAKLGIEPERRIFLLFGVLDSRKGIHQLLEAILLLPPALCQNLCLLLVGPLCSQEKPQVQMQISKISDLLPIQIVLYDQFVIDRENQPFFHISNVVLAPYQRHVGTSSILIRAAAAQKPVLSSNYGLMGEWTQHYQLGLTVDSTDKSEIAKGLTQFLTEPPDKFGDRTQMKFFAEQHSAEEFASVIFKHL